MDEWMFMNELLDLGNMGKVKKVLVIRFSSIGDIVLTTPVVRVLKQQLGMEVHYLTKQSFRAVIASNPHVDKVFCIEKKVKEVLPELKKERYDFVIDLHKNLRSLQVKLGLRCKSYAFDKINFQKWLMVRLKINRLPKVHIVDRYLATAKKLGAVNDGKGLDYFIPVEDEVKLDKYFGDLGRPVPDRFVALVIGAAHRTKRMPLEKIVDICQKIVQPIILLGGPGEAEEGASIAQQAGGHVINACGKLRLNQSASLVRQATTVITHDTGLMHIAAAFQKKVISVWGNTIPEFGMYPYYAEGVDSNLSVQVEGLSCRPCSKIGFQECPKGHFRCMREIDSEVVRNAVN